VELVVCSVRVDRHFPTISPSLKAGKNVFVEWPLGKSAAEARELLKLKNENGVKTAVVGLQARQAPIVNKIKSLVESGAIGKVLSSTWVAQATNGGPTALERVKYIGDKEVGGNLVTIHFGHAVDYFQHALGYGFKSPRGLLENRRTNINLVDAEGKVVRENVPKTADDTIFVTGTLSNGIPVSLSLRGGKPFKGTPGLDWRIYGETGEIRVTGSGPFLQIGYPDMKIELHDFEKDTVEEVEIPIDELDVEAPGAAFGGYASRNVGRLYRGLAKGEVNCSFKDAVDRHEFLEELYKQNGYLQG
jgi:predicted dehydrogenase